MAANTPRIRNRLLKFLSPSDLALLQLSLVPAELPQRHYFESQISLSKKCASLKRP
jgi:hypothetical protein